MGQTLRPWKTIIPLALDGDKAVYQQIADGIIMEIKRGRLKPGTPLPGTRILAEDLGVNRKTVVLAYEGLLDEGWLESIPKKGTFISEKLPVQTGFTKQNNTAKQPVAKPSLAEVAPKPLIVFNDGLPDVRLAPMEELARAYKRIFQQKVRWRMLGYGSERGDERLRSALTSMLSHDRALSIDNDGICVTRGSQMALYLTAHTLLKRGDVVAVEDPGYAAAWRTFENAGAKLLPVQVDEQGICTETLEKICRRKKLKAVYVTPHHQFPTTVSMKADRRMHLLQLANKYGFYIIEDDYDHEYHFGIRSLLPLASNGQTANNVIYISSLSKLIAPSVRIGYIAGPPSFIDGVAALRLMIDRQGDTVMEQAIAELMEDGEIRRHAKRAYTVYASRRKQMAFLIDSYLANKVTYKMPEGGLAYWLTINHPTDTGKLNKKLLQKGVSIIPTEPFSFHKTGLSAIRLGYASLTQEEMEAGFQILGAQL
ncbi:MAG: PLP-dependent aminotransferase family protein [Filimonas sp.]|nr:PLP-dependent aminotransferase family protein [Filimonas sp.]